MEIQPASRIQSVLFSKKHWTLQGAMQWLAQHGYHSIKLDETDKMYRFRQEDPYNFNHFRIKKIKHGSKTIELVIGYPLVHIY